MLPSSPPHSSAPGAWMSDSPDIVMSTMQREPAAEVGVLRLSDQWKLEGTDVIGTLIPPLGPHGIEVLLFELPDRPWIAPPHADAGMVDPGSGWSLNPGQTRLLCGLVDAEPSGVVIVGRGHLPSLLGIELQEGRHAAVLPTDTKRELWVETPIVNRVFLRQTRGWYSVPPLRVPFVAVDVSREAEATVVALTKLLNDSSWRKQDVDEAAGKAQAQGPLRIAVGYEAGHVGGGGDMATILHALCQMAESDQGWSGDQAKAVMDEHLKHQRSHVRWNLHPNRCLLDAVAHVMGERARERSSAAASPSRSVPAGTPLPAPADMRTRCDDVARCFSTSHALGLRGSFRRVVRPAASDWTGHGAGKACEKVVNLLCADMARCCHDWFTAARQASGKSDAARALLSRWLGESLQKSWAEGDATMRAVWRRHAIKPELDTLIDYRESRLLEPADNGRQPWSATVIVEMLKQLRAVGRS